MNSLKINKNKELLTKSLKEMGFKDNQIDYFLNINYRVFDDYKEFNDDKFLQYYDAYIKLVTSEQKLSLNDFFSEVGENFKGFLKSKNLTLEDAYALKFWSSHFYKDILRFKRSLSPSLKVKDMILNDLENELDGLSVDLTISQKEKIMHFARNINLSTPQFDFWENVRNFSKEIGLEKISILGTLERFRIMMRDIEKAINSLDKVTKSRIEENTVLYRGISSINKKFDSINELLGLSLDEIGYTSTSLTHKASFASRDAYPYCIEIYAPKGTECFDITPFSKYYRENEFLLAPNQLLIFDVDANYVDIYGSQKTMLRALAISKNKECYNNTKLEKNIINDEEFFDGKQ